MAGPVVENVKLGNIVKDLYKGTTNPLQVGDGTTASAIRNELATGVATGGRFHTEKGIQISNGPNNLINSGALSYHDSVVAQSLLADLTKAMAGR